MEGKETGKAPPRKNMWKPEEDLALKNYVETHGEGNWATVSKNSGLKRGGKSCRLRWKNYLRPDIKHGDMSEEERDLIIRMHKLIGNRWSLIAGRLPGRTDNEVKNYWNTHLNKKNTTGKRKDFGSNSYRDNSKKIRTFDPESSVRQGILEMESDVREGSKQGEHGISNLANYLLSDTESFHSDTVLDYPDVSANISNAATTFIYNDEPLVTYFDPFLFEVLEYMVG